MKNAFLVGKTTYLRPVELSDTELIQKWHNDPKIRTRARIGELPVTFTKEENDIRVAKDSREEIYFIIMEKSTDKPIGFIRLNLIDPVSKNMWLRFVIGNTNAWEKTSPTMPYVKHSHGFFPSRIYTASRSKPMKQTNGQFVSSESWGSSKKASCVKPCMLMVGTAT
ncbi:MAG: GNAT family N-acetyltransferase [bacterium]